ncbi:LysR family transcriptional regulator [Mesorhizobium sp.]|uniref:LysR family transcriptional regulator n=1 Tax=Mesorhizobium sp. TaxID=1871066 RepID=UPI001207D1D6|nr:LysR family transcriptional regulator [Mesorhizobium sp.]TIO74107.1 MAG: LysR family transcriptional regulator [Mesorhizobium sp.]
MKKPNEDAGFGLKRALAFREVIKCGSTRRAARVLGVTQSAVSQQLKLFEDLVGEKLFIRDRRGLIPTTKAIEIYNKIGRYFDTLERIEREITTSFGSARQSFRIAAPHLSCLLLVPKLISMLVQTEPDTEFYVRAQGYDQIAQNILTGEADVGISRLPLDDRFFEWRTIAESKTVCMMSSEHPLAHKGEITADDIAGEPHIIIDREFSSHYTGMNMLLEPVKVRTDAVGFVAGYVAEGLGISIINEFIAAQCAFLNLTLVPFRPSPTYEYVVFWKLGSAGTVQREAFVSALQSWVNDVGLRPARD